MMQNMALTPEGWANHRGNQSFWYCVNHLFKKKSRALIGGQTIV